MDDVLQHVGHPHFLEVLAPVERMPPLDRHLTEGRTGARVAVHVGERERQRLDGDLPRASAVAREQSLRPRADLEDARRLRVGQPQEPSVPALRLAFDATARGELRAATGIPVAALGRLRLLPRAPTFGDGDDHTVAMRKGSRSAQARVVRPYRPPARETLTPPPAASADAAGFRRWKRSATVSRIAAPTAGATVTR